MERNIKNRVIVASIVAFVSCAIVMAASLSAVKKVTQEDCFEYLSEATDRLATDLFRSADMDHTVLNSLATVISVSKDTSDSNLCSIMSSYVNDSSYISYIELLRPDNTMLDIDGSVRDVSNSLDFEKEASRGIYVSNIETSTKDPNEKVIRNATPVMRDGVPIYIVYGTLRLSDFEKEYVTDIYDGHAYVYLVDSNSGDFLLDTWHNSYGNMTDFLDRKVVYGETLEEVAANMKKGLRGDTAFISQKTGDTQYMHYAPVGINNWSVIVTVQDTYVFKNSEDVNRILIRMAVIAALIAFVYMLLVIKSLLDAYHRIKKIGMNDQVTDLPNRNAYDAYISANNHTSFPLITCIFVDINGLHERNNNEGHDAGDKLLRSVADALKSTFRDAYIFRTGGDEFVVITEKLDREQSTDKAVDMSIDLMKEGNSIAYGVATQKDGIGISELINNADARMMKNKQLYYSCHDRRMRD